jgi:hypothetical protein
MFHGIGIGSELVPIFGVAFEIPMERDNGLRDYFRAKLTRYNHILSSQGTGIQDFESRGVI